MFESLTGNSRVKEVLETDACNKPPTRCASLRSDEGIGKKLFALEVAPRAELSYPRRS